MPPSATVRHCPHQCSNPLPPALTLPRTATASAALGNSWRIGPDDTNWPGVLSDIDDMAALWSYAVRMGGVIRRGERRGAKR